MKSKGFAFWFLCLFMLTFIGIFCYLSLYSHPNDDDFSYASSAETYGAWGTAVRDYMHGVPRVPGNFILAALLKYLGALKNFWAIPIISIFTYVLAAYFLITTLYPKIEFSKKFLSSLILTAGGLAMHCALDEVLYYVAAMPYILSTSMMLLSLAFYVKYVRGGGY